MATYSSSPASPLPAAGRLLPRPATMASDAWYLLAGLPVGVVTFSVLVSGLATALGLAITLAGIPVGVASLYAARAFGDLERRRAGVVLGSRVTRTARPWNAGGAWQRCKTALTDVGAWRDTVWGLILLPLGTFGFSVAVTVWSAALGFATSPLWYWALPDDDDSPGRVVDWLQSTSLTASIAHVAIGLALIPVAAWTCRALADATARAARALLQH